MLFCLALLSVGCSADHVSETSTAENVPEQVETTVPETEPISLEELLANSDHNFRELNRPAETENPTAAEEIYRTLYDYADFYDYVRIYMPYFADKNDTIRVERVIYRDNRCLVDSPELFGRQDWEEYYRITGGRITTAKEYYRALCQCASDHFLANDDRDGFETTFQLSDGNLYLSQYAYDGNYTEPASSDLDKITRLDEDRLLLEFTAFTNSYFPDGAVYTEPYTVTVRYETEYGRWKVDEYDFRATWRLCNEIIQGGTHRESPKTDLPEQIERCLKEIGLM